MSLLEVFKERLAMARGMQAAPEPKFISMNEKNFRRLLHDAVDGTPDPLLTHFYDGVQVMVDDMLDSNLIAYRDKDGNMVKQLRIVREEPKPEPVKQPEVKSEPVETVEPVKEKKKFIGRKK